MMLKEKGDSIGDLLNRAQALPAARRFLIERRGVPAKTVEAMAPAHLLLLHLAGEYFDARDDYFKAVYLPFPQARPILDEARKRRDEKHFAWAGIKLLRALLPALDRVLLAHARLERKIAALRLVEALRLHAAANKGQLPESLDQLKVVPVPLDPCTGRPFVYRLDGDIATIISDLPAYGRAQAGLRIHVTMRK
jgi:hypothetical protein